MNINAIMQVIAVSAIPLIFAITLHEAAHGWLASKFGDKTALMLGRVTMNPIKHIDPLGTIVLPILILIFSGGKFMFGWAKPVPIYWRNLKNPRRDMALVALAGPAANLLMALLWAIIAKLAFISFTNPQGVALLVARFIILSSYYGITLNIIFMVLNLIPIPPLDGSRVISSILPVNAADAYERIEPYGFFILLGLLAFGILGQIIWPPMNYIVTLIKSLFGLPLGN